MRESADGTIDSDEYLTWSQTLVSFPGLFGETSFPRPPKHRMSHDLILAIDRWLSQEVGRDFQSRWVKSAWVSKGVIYYIKDPRMGLMLKIKFADEWLHVSDYVEDLPVRD